MTYQHIQGARELERALTSLPAKLEAKLLRQALRDGAVVLQQGARSRVAVRKGELRKTIRVSTARRRGVVIAAVKAGDRRKGVFYAHLVEGGTKPHKIRPNRGKRLRLANFFVAKVEHPGSRPKPFMKPSLDRDAERAIATIAASLRRRLPEVAR